jgi:hypothetical protein
MPSKPFAVIPADLGSFDTVASEVAGHPASNLGEFNHIGMTWKTEDSAGPVNNCWIIGDFAPNAPQIDFVSLLHAAVPSTATWLFALTDDATLATYDFSTGFIPFMDPVITREDGLYSTHLELPAPLTHRYWYLEIRGVPAALEAAKLIVGKKIEFANYYSPGFEFGTEDLGDMEIGRWGVPEETPGLIFRRLTAKFGWMSRADMDEKFRPLVERVGKRTPILFCMDPEATVNRQARTYFGWLREPPFFTGAVNKFDRYEAEFSILSMI